MAVDITEDIKIDEYSSPIIKGKVVLANHVSCVVLKQWIT
jgi:hypothetical protein